MKNEREAFFIKIMDSYALLVPCALGRTTLGDFLYFIF
jgi:hypothetical protein